MSAMGESANIASLMQRNRELEQERDELRKDIEQLCMQQAGTGYLSVITRIQAQRAAGLENDIEMLKKKLNTCVRDNHNLQEELSEVYRIKSQLADLHKLELEKNYEAEEQIKFFQNSIASAFSERDHALMEAERAQQNEKALSDKLSCLQTRIEEINAVCIEQKNLCSELQSNLEYSRSENLKLKAVVDKFYEIRNSSLGITEDEKYDDRAVCLIQDPADNWSYTEEKIPSGDKLVILAEQLEDAKNELNEAQAFKDALVKKNSDLEQKLNEIHQKTRAAFSALRAFHAQNRCAIIDLIEENRKWLDSTIATIGAHTTEKDIREIDRIDYLNKTETQSTSVDLQESEEIIVKRETTYYCGSEEEKKYNFFMANYDESSNTEEGGSAFVQALQEKVQALLLLSQQEERHLLEKNTYVAMEEKVQELQQKLSQVTNDKVSALMEIAQLKQKYQQLQEQKRKEVIGPRQQGNSNFNSGDARESKGMRLFKHLYQKQWLRGIDIAGYKSIAHTSEINQSIISGKTKESMDFARMKIENASFHENMTTMEHLVSSIHKLRLSLLKIKEDLGFSITNDEALLVTENIIKESQSMKTALGLSLPVSWSADSNPDPQESSGYEISQTNDESHTVSSIDIVSAMGLELVELLLLASELQKSQLMQVVSKHS